MVLDGFAAVRRGAEAWPAVVTDVVIAVLCYLATAALQLTAARDEGWMSFVLAALATLPLVWRRRQPVVVAAIVGAGTIVMAATGGLDNVTLPYGPLVATYTVASLASPLWRLLVMACTAVGVCVVVLILLGEGPTKLGIAALPFVVAYAFGVSGRARRDRIAMLEERTRRLAEEQEAAAARERERIAREIHDIVAHSVSLMVVQAEAGLVLSTDPNRANQTFDTISATGREALTQLGRALGLLRGDDSLRRPQPGLDDLPALMDRARLAGLEAELVEQGSRRVVPADLAAAVYRLVQEAVTNTIKHAAARRIRACLLWQPAAVRVEVSDDGRGPVPVGAAYGRGLTGMRERVQAFGGELRTGAGAAGTGFRVAATLPIPSQAPGGSGDE